MKADEGFDVLLRSALRISFPANLQQSAEQRATRYDADALRVAETKKETERQRVIARYRGEFIDGPILRLQFQNMHVQFDPRNLQPLGDAGTVYPNLRISDDWGVLEVSHGALMKPDWSAVIVAAPQAVRSELTKGDGWTLQLKAGWKIIPDRRVGDFILSHGF